MPQLLVSEQSLLAKNLCLKHIDFNLSRSWAGPAHAPQQQPRLAVRRDHVLALPAHGGQPRAGGQPPRRAEGVPARDFVHRDAMTVADTNVEVLITVRLVVRVDSVDTQDPLLSLNTVSSPQSTPSPLLHAPLTLCVASPDLL